MCWSVACIGINPFCPVLSNTPSVPHHHSLYSDWKVVKEPSHHAQKLRSCYFSLRPLPVVGDRQVREEAGLQQWLSVSPRPCPFLGQFYYGCQW